jgi:putative ABC transport system ATP-binding protein
VTVPVLDVAGVSKDYRGLRPLRIERLTVAPGELVAMTGFDQVTAEVFVNLVTGATLPDHGDVTVFGRATSAIGDSAEWLALVDRFGIVSERAVLLDQLTVIQNLSMPFTLEIQPPAAEIADQARRLATEVGIPEAAWERPVAELEPRDRVRVRVGRAIALDPAILLVEHASAGLAEHDAAALGADLQGIATRRSAAIVAVTADGAFAAAVATRRLTLDAATGRLKDAAGRGWFRGRLG